MSSLVNVDRQYTLTAHTMKKKAILPAEIRIDLHPSKFLWGWLLCFSTLCLCCLWVSLPVIQASVLTLGFAIALVQAWKQLPAVRYASSLRCLRIDVYGEMTVSSQTQSMQHVVVLPTSVVHRWAMLLHVREQGVLSGQSRLGKVRYMVLLPDHMRAEDWRALSVWLRWGWRLQDKHSSADY